MKASELRSKSTDELNAELHKLLEESFRLRTSKATGQLTQTHLLRENQRNVARIKTVLQQQAK
ncbi:MAG: 50S ribosomal protein L29 [Pseudomonadales bacterium]|nr:50S ribosomal protein L29 [Gammaproteobacteria bacterium]NNL56579.1 50S ribosomal protein L29 [Pseudomonadales bacterium]